MRTHSRPFFESIVQAALGAVHAGQAVASCVRRRGRNLSVGKKFYDLRRFHDVRLIAIGKASVPMAGAICTELAETLAGGVVVTKKGYLTRRDPIRNHFKKHGMLLIESGHPEPDSQSLRAGRAIAQIARRAGSNTLLICCVSGGASALAVLPTPGISLASYRRVNQKLIKSGAPIDSINAVRKTIDQLKGGGLVELARPAQIASLIVSDVVGDSVATIASGLTDHPHADNLIVANNTLACRAVAQIARKAGFQPRIVTTTLSGEARVVGAQIAREIAEAPAGTCLIYGGETTVTIKGSPGKGGRNQELILAAAVELHRLGAQKQIALASFGTDGIDGASDAAGAICTGETIHRARKAGLNPRKLLADHDSHHFFKTLDDLIITGQTGTNVADVVVAIHSAPQKRRRTAPATRSEKSVR